MCRFDLDVLSPCYRCVRMGRGPVAGVVRRSWFQTNFNEVVLWIKRYQPRLTFRPVVGTHPRVHHVHLRNIWKLFPVSLGTTTTTTTTSATLRADTPRMFFEDNTRFFSSLPSHFHVRWIIVHWLECMATVYFACYTQTLVVFLRRKLLCI